MLKLAKIERRGSEERRSKTKEGGREKMEKKTRNSMRKETPGCAFQMQYFRVKGGEGGFDQGHSKWHERETASLTKLGN